MKKLAWIITVLLLLYLVAIPAVSIVRTLCIGIPSEETFLGGKTFTTMPLYKESLVLFLCLTLGIVVEFFIKKKRGYFKEVGDNHDSEEQ